MTILPHILVLALVAVLTARVMLGQRGGVDVALLLALLAVALWIFATTDPADVPRCFASGGAC